MQTLVQLTNSEWQKVEMATRPSGKVQKLERHFGAESESRRDIAETELRRVGDLT